MLIDTFWNFPGTELIEVIDLKASEDVEEAGVDEVAEVEADLIDLENVNLTDTVAAKKRKAAHFIIHSLNQVNLVIHAYSCSAQGLLPYFLVV